MNTDLMFGSSRFDWGTPQVIYQPLHEQFEFNLDVCAHAGNHKCDWYYTEEDDGLTTPWAPSRCWLNPPYGKYISKWMIKMAREVRRDALVVSLLPARPDTQWFQRILIPNVEVVLFFEGRITFEGHLPPNAKKNFPGCLDPECPGGVEGCMDPAPFPSVITVARGREGYHHDGAHTLYGTLGTLLDWYDGG